MADTMTHVSEDGYARAERFLRWNESRYVLNGDIKHHWIGTEDRLWYLRTNAADEKEFVVVDAATGQRTPAFDQSRIAKALSTQAGETIEAGHLPFSRFHYTQDNTAIQFQFKEKTWTCSLKLATCRGAPQTVAANEAVSPDGQWSVFLKSDNLWLRSTSGGAEFPLTTDGRQHYNYAGSPGYSRHAVSDIRHPKPKAPQVIWSPDSRYVLTHRIDERLVKEFYLLQSVPEDGSVRPKLYPYRFAVPGDEHLPLWEPVVLDVVARRRVSLATRPMICFTNTPIEKRETWWSADSKRIYFLDWDRFMRSVSLHRSELSTGAVSQVLRESSRTLMRMHGGNPLQDGPAVKVLSNGDVVWYSQRDGWGHLYHHDDATGILRQITQGEWTVRSISHVDEAAGLIYFMASGRELGRDPYEQYLYSIHIDGSRLRLLTPEEGDHGSLSKPLLYDPRLSETSRRRFSPSGRYFVDSYSRPDRVPVLALRAQDGRLIKRLEQADISKLRQGGYVPIEPFQVLAADGETTIYGNLFRPSTFDSARRYPVIDAVYPGPQMIRTRKDFVGATFDWFEAQSLAELGFIVITVDGRGTPHRSKAFLDHSYGRLDKASDPDDHIAAIRQLAERYPYIDLTKVGIDGVSGGGYAAAHAVLSYPDFYKVAVSAEGNHDQRAGYSFWGEMWIGPLNVGDYHAASNLPLAGKLKGKLLLMHGELDDNVSPTVTMKLVDALIKKNKDFDLLIIPNGDHGAFASPYFIRKKWDYFVRNLLGAEPPADYEIHGPF